MKRSLLVILSALSLFGASASCQADPDFWRFGFYWSPTYKTYPPARVPWDKYTHISQIAIVPTSNCQVDDNSYVAGRVGTDLVRTAHQNGVKVLITLLQDKPLVAIAKCTAPDRLQDFATTIAKYVAENRYDGVDIDWEFGVVPAQYESLVRALRSALPDGLLTADVAVQQRDFISRVQDHLDRVNLMNYDLHQTDYHGHPVESAWHQAAVKSKATDAALKSGASNVEYLLRSDIAPSKINYGVPFYGYAISACNSEPCSSSVTDLSQAFSAQSVKITQLTYSQIAKYLKDEPVQWDQERQASYIAFHASHLPHCRDASCKCDSFITFSDPKSVDAAVSYALGAKLGGVMTFALHQEFMDTQAGDSRYPLSSAMYSRIQREGRL